MYRTIVCGVMPAESALTAARHACSLAERYGATLHLVSSFEGPAEPDQRSTPGGSVGRHEAEAFLDREFGQLPYARLHAMPGQPANSVLQVAEEFDADLIVVGNRGMKGAQRVLGSVPNTISHKATCSVLIVNTTS
jgi:nucleotide-binding universal stress UspA family protein